MGDGAKVPVCLYSVNTPTHSTVYVITILVFCKLSAQNVYSTKSKAWRDNCDYHKIAVLHLTTMYFSSLNLFFLFSSLCVLLSPPCSCYSLVFLSPSCSCYSLTHRCCASPLFLILLFTMDHCSLSSSNQSQETTLPWYSCNIIIMQKPAEVHYSSFDWESFAAN